MAACQGEGPRRRSLARAVSRILPASLDAPGVRERSHRCSPQPERVDDAKVFKASFGTGPAKQVLGDVKLSRRLRGREQAFGVAAVIEACRMLADHGLTKVLVLA